MRKIVGGIEVSWFVFLTPGVGD